MLGVKPTGDAPVQRIYTAQNPLMVAHVRNLLEEDNIEVVMRNFGLLGGAGELPPTAVWPELWLVNDSDEPRARRIVDAALAENAEPGQAWACAECGEVMEGQFDACWSCGAQRPAG